MIRRSPARAAAILIAVPSLLLLVGAGCFDTADRLAEEAVTPITVPVDALGQAKVTLGEADAAVNRQNEASSADMTVAMIQTEGSEPSTFATLGENIGCNDRVAFVKAHRETDTGQVVTDALNTLFAVREATFQGTYNSLWQSSLTVADIRSTDGVTTEVRLEGQVIMAGACDAPRVKAQIEHTIKRFRPQFKVLLNGSEAEWRCLGDQSGECQ